MGDEIDNSNNPSTSPMIIDQPLEGFFTKEIIILDTEILFEQLDNIFTLLKQLGQETDEKLAQVKQIVEKINHNTTLLYPNKYITESINTLEDLIHVAKLYGTETEPRKNFSVNTKILYDMIDPLESLNNIIGMKNIKDQLVDQILGSMTNVYDDDMMFHTVILGAPGVGKTKVAKIIGELYLKMGLLKGVENPIFKIARRSDLIGKYLGHTAIKTQELIDQCIGGVMFIDEVYSLGNEEKKDSFSKECIDTINMNLTEKKNFICIIAGYPEEIETCFFSYNPGLERRFPFVYEINGYTPIELANMFIFKLNESGWILDVDNTRINSFMERNMEHFGNYGGDIDNLVRSSKIAHARRIFGKGEIIKNITLEDVENGLIKMLIAKKDKGKDINKFNMMYV